MLYPLAKQEDDVHDFGMSGSYVSLGSKWSPLSLYSLPAQKTCVSYGSTVRYLRNPALAALVSAFALRSAVARGRLSIYDTLARVVLQRVLGQAV